MSQATPEIILYALRFVLSAGTRAVETGRAFQHQLDARVFVMTYTTLRHFVRCRGVSKSVSRHYKNAVRCPLARHNNRRHRVYSDTRMPIRKMISRVFKRDVEG